MSDFLTWQVALGILIVGYILGFASAIVYANLLIRRRNRKKADAEDC